MKRQRTDLAVEAQSSSSTDIVPLQAVERGDVFTCKPSNNGYQIIISNGKLRRYLSRMLLNPITNNTIADYVKMYYNVDMPSLTQFEQISILCELESGRLKNWESKLQDKKIVTSFAGWIHQGYSPDNAPDFDAINTILSQQRAIYDSIFFRDKTVERVQFLAEILTNTWKHIEKFNEDHMTSL